MFSGYRQHEYRKQAGYRNLPQVSRRSPGHWPSAFALLGVPKFATERALPRKAPRRGVKRGASARIAYHVLSLHRLALLSCCRCCCGVGYWGVWGRRFLKFWLGPCAAATDRRARPEGKAEREARLCSYQAFFTTTDTVRWVRGGLLSHFRP